MDFLIKTNKEGLSQKRIENYLKLSEVINWGRKYPVRFVERVLGIELLDYQKYVFLNSWATPYCVWCQSRSSGKALALDTKIPTPNGFTTMGEIKVGDYVFDSNGKQSMVTYVSDVFLNHRCYEIEFEDKEKIIADAEHLWEVVWDTKTSNGVRIMTTEDMANTYSIIRKSDGKTENIYRVNLNKPIQYKYKDFVLDPYVLGLWLGDGSTGVSKMTCHEDDLEEMCKNINECGFTTKIYYNKNRAPAIGIGTVKKGQKNRLVNALRDLNILHKKAIPEEYLYGSVEQRLELLRGLMDTDGSCNGTSCEFSQKDYNIIKQFSRLLNSLGIKNTINKRITKLNNKEFESYRVYFVVDQSNNCFKLKRKKDKVRNNIPEQSTKKTILSIKETDSVPTKCISVDNPENLYLCGENFTITHNTTLSAPFIMSKTMLIPNFRVYILAGSGSQSQECFKKIENIAKKNIASFTGVTDVFYNETVKSHANTDGFTHGTTSFEYNLFNGSGVNSLNSNVKNIRSKRSNLNFYDEGGFAPEELFTASEPFTVQDSSFRLGGGGDPTLFPKQFQNQLIYASSASSTDTYFWRKYNEFSKKMFIGDKRYFVADINCDVVTSATFNGKIYKPALLTKETIDAKMIDNKEVALREYRNIFSTEGGDQQAIKRASIIRNSEVRLPKLCNEGNEKFVLAYDPARSYDNSIFMAAELIDDKNVGYKLKVCNVVSFVDIQKKNKTPIRTPEQIEYIKQYILDYNGNKAADYENIESLMIDAGAGGGGIGIGDFLMEDWRDKRGVLHKGLIDKQQSADYVSRFPNAMDKLKLIVPQTYKVEMYDALVEMIGLDLISFTDYYDMKGYLTIYENDDDNKLKVNEKKYNLSFEQELALKNIDLTKEEIVNIWRFDSGKTGRVSYDLSPDKKHKMNDDKSYCLAMLAWYLQQKRRSCITNRKKEKVNWSKFIMY